MIKYLLIKKTKVYNRLDRHMQEILCNASLALILKIMAAALNFAFTVAVARIYGAKEAGVFFLALTIVTISSVVGRVGLDNVLLRHTAVWAETGELGKIRTIYRKSMLLAFSCSSCLVIIIFVLSPWLCTQVFSEPELSRPLRWMAIAIVPHAIFWLHAEVIKGLKRIPLFLFVQSISLPLLSLVVICFIKDSGEVVSAVMAYSVSAIVTAIFGYISLKTIIGGLHNSEDIVKFSEIFSSSISLFLVAIMNLIVTWAPTIFLGVWSGSADVGIFSASQRTASLTSFILIAINSISAPKFAELYHRKDFSGLEAAAKNSTILMTISASPILLMFLIFPHFVLGIFGSNFDKGATLLSIMAVGQFINVATGSVGYLLMMSNNGKILSKCLSVSAVISLALCLILIPKFGSLGAAITFTCSLSIMNLATCFFVFSKLKISTVPFFSYRRA